VFGWRGSGAGTCRDCIGPANGLGRVTKFSVRSDGCALADGCAHTSRSRAGGIACSSVGNVSRSTTGVVASATIAAFLIGAGLIFEGASGFPWAGPRVAELCGMGSRATSGNAAKRRGKPAAPKFAGSEPSGVAGVSEKLRYRIGDAESAARAEFTSLLAFWSTA
jgi:hypothetical protein